MAAGSEGPPPEGQLVRRSWGTLGRLLRYPLLVRLVAHAVWPLYLRWRHGGRQGQLDIARVARLRDAAPPRLAAAVDAGGGIARLHTSLSRHQRFEVAATIAACLTGDLGAGRYVSTVGQDVLDEAVASGPVVLAVPHLGAWTAIAPWLLARGHRVAVLGGPAPAGVERRLLRREARGRLVQIDVDDRLAAAKAGKALRRGAVLCWGGDAMVGHASTGRRLLVDYLGYPTSVSPFIYHVGRMARPTYLMGVAHLGEAGTPTISLRFHRLDMPTDGELRHVETIYENLEREIVQNYGQWSLWRALDLG